jgi:TolB-like protein/tetratricopeptide (TPR) repeat protein
MPATAPDIPDALLAVELERLAASDAFRRAPRQVRVLQYLVAEVRAGRGQRLKESVVAVEALGLSASRFDSRTDTTVRVMIGRLRQRLARYYAGDGAWAAVEIAIPVGSYAPRLALRSQHGGAKLPSVAVLPFLNLTGEPGADVVCDALAEEIIDVLARLPGVKVVARTSSFRFKGALADARTIGHALSVATLVEGSVQVGPGGRLKVVAQWIRADDGFHAWSHNFEAAAGEKPASLQVRVAHEIVAGLQRRLRDLGPLQRSSAPPPRRTANGAALELYNDGRYLLRLDTLDGYRRAIDALRQATVADPEFALAHCALGRALVGMIAMTLVPADGMLTGARRAIARALALDPELGEAHALAGFIACAFDRRWADAEPAFLRGLRGAPSLPYAHSAYARELDPLELRIRAHQALVALYAGDYDRATAGLAAVLALDPRHVVAQVLLATTALWRGDLDAADARFRELVAAHPTLTIGAIGLAQVEAAAGRGRAARARLARLQRSEGSARHLPSYQVAMVHARLGDADAALAWLERAAQEYDMNFVCAPLDRAFAALRPDPRFGALLGQHGLQPLWRAGG